MLFIRRLVLLLFAVIALSCGAAPKKFKYTCVMPDVSFRRTVYLDERFSHDHVKLIKEAAAKWKRQSGGIVNYTISEHKFKHFELHKVFPKFVGNDVFVFFGNKSDVAGKENELIMGMANATTIDLVMDRIIGTEGWDRRLVGVTMHEIGHSIGIMKHIDDHPDALMAPYCTWACDDPQLTIYDINALCDVASAMDADKNSGPATDSSK